MENHDYLCYEIFAPGRTDEDAISNICICRSEKEKRGWIDEMIKSLSSPDVNGVKYTVAKIEGKEDRWIVVDEFGIHSELVCIPLNELYYRK